MRKFFMLAFAALALTVAAPTKASASSAGTKGTAIAPVSTQAKGAAAFNDCGCTYYRYTYRVRYYHYSYRYTYRYTYYRYYW